MSTKTDKEKEEEAEAAKAEAATPVPVAGKEFGPVTDTPVMNQSVEGGRYQNTAGELCDANGKPVKK